MMARKSRYFFNVLDIILREIFKSSNVIKNSEGGRLTCFPLLLAVAISPSTAICPWNLFCRDHSRVFI